MNTMQRISGGFWGALLALLAFCALGLAGCASQGSSPTVGVGTDMEILSERVQGPPRRHPIGRLDRHL